MLKKIFGVLQIIAGAAAPLASGFIHAHAAVIAAIVLIGNGIVHAVEALSGGQSN